ncbi:MAG: aminomethyltransferase family protein [Solirubrobacterales bacterium]|nr:aminomethyltransferase family protein [Solirubrobacterales bacterium]MBV9717583.1 aminomethyltransferase family protein [Solirubrobacterales bacterium]
MTERSLEDLLNEKGNPAEMLRNSQAGPNVYPGVPAEFTNWRDEQHAWQHACVLFNQSYHMADLAVRGPDALKLLTRLGVNSFENFAVDKAKQFVPCTPDGYVIGDVILFYLSENEFNLVGRAPVLNWITYHAETGGYNAQVELDQRWALRTDNRRRSFRFQVQGPNAMKVIEKVLGKQPPEIRFFNMETVEIAGKSVRALRHGMAGQAGWEVFGDWADGEAVREAIVTAGEEFGLRQVGGRAYSSNALESGWVPSPLPAVYSGESLKDYRRWLPASGYEGTCSIGGSFYSDDVEDYYFTPWDLSYGHLVKFDHDFIGRDALERRASEGGHRVKVTLALEDEDVTRTLGMMFRKSERAKFMDWPSAVYAMHPFDKVTVDGATVGVSTWIGYSSNEGKMLTLAVLEPEHAEPGTEVTLVWGEENGGSSKPTVERHVQTEMRAIVSPVPYVETVRRQYAPGSWREARV